MNGESDKCFLEWIKDLQRKEKIENYKYEILKEFFYKDLRYSILYYKIKRLKKTHISNKKELLTDYISDWLEAKIDYEKHPGYALIKNNFIDESILKDQENKTQIFLKYKYLTYKLRTSGKVGLFSRNNKGKYE